MGPTRRLMALAFAHRALVRTYDAALSMCQLEGTTAVLLRLRDRHQAMRLELMGSALGDSRGPTDLRGHEELARVRRVDDLGSLLAAAEAENRLLRRCQAALEGELPSGIDAALVKLRALVESNLRSLSRALVVDRTWAADGGRGKSAGAA